MVAFPFGQLSDAIRETQSLGKITETKNAFQSRDGLPLHQRP
jgi:hypothetical protein